MAAGPAVAAMPRVTKPGDAEEVEAEKVAARVTSGQPTGPIDATEPAAARAADESTVRETTPPIARAAAEPAQEAAKPPVARAAAEPAKEEARPPVARAADATPKDTAQPATDVKPVARAAAGTDAPPASTPVTDAITSPGQGRPMAPSTREAIERRAPVDLKGVRVHDDATANQAASSIDARAFTHGSDIWLAHGESDKDVGLMAHEAAHVAQQGPAVKPAKNSVARAPAKKSTGTLTAWPESGTSPKGSIDTDAKTVKLGTLKIPKIKVPFSKDIDLHKRKRTNTQIASWDKLTKNKPDVPGKLPDGGERPGGGERRAGLLPAPAQGCPMVRDRDGEAGPGARPPSAMDARGRAGVLRRRPQEGVAVRRHRHRPGRQPVAARVIGESQLRLADRRPGRREVRRPVEGRRAQAQEAARDRDGSQSDSGLDRHGRCRQRVRACGQAGPPLRGRRDQHRQIARRPSPA